MNQSNYSPSFSQSDFSPGATVSRCTSSEPFTQFTGPISLDSSSTKDRQYLREGMWTLTQSAQTPISRRPWPRGSG